LSWRASAEHRRRSGSRSSGASSRAIRSARSAYAVGATIKKESRLVLVDAVVTDKKGNYLHDLAQGDFKVYETTKSSQSQLFQRRRRSHPANPQNTIWFCFLTTLPWRCPIRFPPRRCGKFIDSNAAPDHLMAVVEFGGALRIMQNFTANAALLQAAAKGVKSAYVASNADAASASGSAFPWLVYLAQPDRTDYALVPCCFPFALWPKIFAPFPVAKCSWSFRPAFRSLRTPI